MNQTSNFVDPDDRCKDPIFILGILERSGTNYLYNLLRLHPDCEIADPIWEDYLLYDAEHVIQYSKSVGKRWCRIWKVEGIQDDLCEKIGSGIISILTSKVGQKRLITKTPSVHNLDLFFKLFPHVRLLIIVRDGREIIESGVIGFGWHYEVRMRKLAIAARTILKFDQESKGSNNKYLIVKYEDICSNLEEKIHQILNFLDLDAEKYDFNAARTLPIRGSSEIIRQGGKKVHWQPTERTADFDSSNRSRHWNRYLHERFNWIAGSYLKQLGYTEKEFKTNRIFWMFLNMIMDVKLNVLWLLERLRHLWNRKYQELR